MKSLLFFSLLFSTSLSYSLIETPDKDVLKEMQEIILSDANCTNSKEKIWKSMTAITKIHTKFWTKSKYKLHYSKFGCELGRKGSLVIAPGRTEASIEYYETALDFMNRGYSPVYVVDHVSQGFSPRLLADPHKGHIYRFSDYVDAFDDAVKSIISDLKVLGRTNEPLFFTSNSMGGAIGIGYFQKKGESNPFKAAALLGPMIRINYLSFVGITRPTWFQKQKFSETGVIAQARYQCKVKGCDEYATKPPRDRKEQYGSAYVEGQRNFVEATQENEEAVMTHSKSRYDLRTWLWESDEADKVYSSLGLINPQLSGATYQWAKQAAKFNPQMRSKSQITKMSKMPLLIVTGTRDLRAYTPYKDGSTDLSEHSNFCNNVNKIKGNGVCSFQPFEGSFHEIYKESKVYRHEGFRRVIRHFNRATHN